MEGYGEWIPARVCRFTPDGGREWREDRQPQKDGATGANEADFPAKGFDDFWIYPLEALDLPTARGQRAVSTRSNRLEPD